VTSIIMAVLERFLQYRPSPRLIFKLAAIAHVKTQGSGSGADIAASTYGGLLYYTSFQASWLMKEMKNTDAILPLIQKKWRYLTIEPLTFPENIATYIGWTGKPASTRSLVREISKLKTNNRRAYNHFLTESKQAVATILTGIKRGDFATFCQGIKRNRQALKTLGVVANVPIETDKLAKLSDVAEQLSGAGKLSGAGGGDCGLAFLPNNSDSKVLYQMWKRYDIQPLSLAMEQTGTVVEKHE